MAKTVLVPTDFSENSKAGIRFAIQLALQAKFSLVFYHCLPFMKPTRWSEARYDAYVKNETETAVKTLTGLVNSILQNTGVKKTSIQYVVQQRPDVLKAIIGFAREIQATAICLSTRGAGRFKKIIGTHASGVISNSSVPVFIIPGNYRRSRISRILYASDLNQIGPELKQVRTIGKLLKTKISVYHYDYLADVVEVKKNLEKVAKRYKYPDVDFKFLKFSIDRSLAQHLEKDMRKSKASLAVLFTNQKRGWFDRLFLPSRSRELAFVSKAPLLVLPKNA